MSKSTARKVKYKNLDKKCQEAIKNPNMIVPWYLMASYCYYVEDVSLLSDDLFDKVCSSLKDKWEQIEHRHKYLVDYQQLSAGTGFALDFDSFPSLIIGAALRASLELE